MGYLQLAEMAELITPYRSFLEPMAIIQNATFPDLKVIFANAGRIAAAAAKYQIEMSAVVVAARHFVPTANESRMGRLI